MCATGASDSGKCPELNQRKANKPKSDKFARQMPNEPKLEDAIDISELLGRKGFLVDSSNILDEACIDDGSFVFFTNDRSVVVLLDEKLRFRS